MFLRATRLGSSFLLALSLTAACTPKNQGGDEPKHAGGGVTIEKLENQGHACISGDAGQPLEVAVDFDTCMSSSCDELKSASCTVEQSGTELIVQARAEISHEQGACTEDCGFVEVRCSTEPLAAGTYTLVYAGTRKDVEVPLSEPACTNNPS